MVESASTTAMIVDIIICIGMPLGCLVYLLYKRQKPLIPFFSGVAVYITFQLILYLTIMGFVATMAWYKDLQNNKWLLTLFTAVVVGIFTEAGRFAGIKLLLKDRRLFSDGVSLGAGYAGIEAIFVGALSYIGNLSFSNMINSGQTDQITAMLGPEKANEAIHNLTTALPIDIYIGGLDHIFVFIIHIALSLLVLLGIRKRKPAYLGIAVLAHLLYEGLPAALTLSNLVFIIYLGVLTALAVVFILRIKKQFVEDQEEE